jgi:hypothetical protein
MPDDTASEKTGDESRHDLPCDLARARLRFSVAPGREVCHAVIKMEQWGMANARLMKRVHQP